MIAELQGGNLQALSTLTTLSAFKQITAAAGQIVKAGYKINS